MVQVCVLETNGRHTGDSVRLRAGGVVEESVFFFQAEDDIRDLGRSRGLGDVYKRQERNQSCVRELSRPVRAHSSPEERLQALRLSDAHFGKDLQQFFVGKRLRDSRAWLQALAEPPYRETLTLSLIHI